MEVDDTSGDEAESEPKVSGPGRESVVRPGPLPAVSSVADHLMGKAWVADSRFKFDNFLAGSPGMQSAMDALVRSGSEAGLGMSKLMGSEYLSQVVDAGPKLTDLWAKTTGRAWDELHAGHKLTDLWAKAAGPVWPELHAGRGLGAELAAEAAARAAGADVLFARAATPVWEGLRSGVSDLAKSFLPAAPDLSALPGFTSGLAGKVLAGPDLGSFAGLDLDSPSRFFLGEHLNVAGPAFCGDQWPWSKRLGAGVFEGATAAMHRHAQGLSSWMETTHRAAMDALWRAPEESIATMLQSFSTLADHGVVWGWQALWTALRARRAVLCGDVAAVVRFMREWLGFKRTPPTLVDAASAVLLEEAAWLPAELDVDEDVCPRIRQLTIREHRNFRPIGDTELCGRSVDSLDREVRISRDEAVSVPLVEVVPAPPPPAGVDDISDPRLVWIIDRLTERERTILRVRAEEARNWADAAVSCGATRAEVENLRRKVKRLGKAVDGTVAVVSTGAVS